MNNTMPKKSYDLSEMNKFAEGHDTPKFTQGEIDHQNTELPSKEKVSGQLRLSVNSRKHLRKWKD